MRRSAYRIARVALALVLAASAAGPLAGAASAAPGTPPAAAPAAGATTGAAAPAAPGTASGVPDLDPGDAPPAGTTTAPAAPGTASGVPDLDPDAGAGLGPQGLGDQGQQAPGGSSRPTDTLRDVVGDDGLCSAARRATLSADAHARCGSTGSVANAHPLDHYGLDVAVQVKATDPATWAANALQTVISLVWMGLLFALKGTLMLLQWGFSLDLYERGRDRTDHGLAALLHAVGEPWMPAALGVAGLWGIWNGLVRQKASETLGGLAMTVALMSAAMVLVTQPDRTIGHVTRLASDAAMVPLGVASATVEPTGVGGLVGARGLSSDAAAAPGGLRSSSQRMLADSIHDVFDATALPGWCTLQFGSIRYCTDHGSGRPSVADIWLAYPAGSTARWVLHRLTKDGEPAIKLMTGFGGLKNLEPEKDRARIGPKGLQVFTVDPALREAQATAARAVREMSDPQPDAVRLQEAGGTAQRFALLLLVAVGMLGAILIFLFLGIRLVTAGVWLLLLLLAAPVVMLAPAFGEAGRAFFLRWVRQLLGKAVAKLVYAVALTLVLLVTGVIVSLRDASGSQDMSAFLVWLILAAFWWMLFLQREQLLGLISVEPQLRGGGLAQAYYGMRMMGMLMRGATAPVRALGRGTTAAATLAGRYADAERAGEEAVIADAAEEHARERATAYAETEHEHEREGARATLDDDARRRDLLREHGAEVEQIDEDLHAVDAEMHDLDAEDRGVGVQLDQLDAQERAVQAELADNQHAVADAERDMRDADREAREVRAGLAENQRAAGDVDRQIDEHERAGRQLSGRLEREQQLEQEQQRHAAAARRIGEQLEEVTGRGAAVETRLGEVDWRLAELDGEASWDPPLGAPAPVLSGERDGLLRERVALRQERVALQDQGARLTEALAAPRERERSTRAVLEEHRAESERIAQRQAAIPVDDLRSERARLDGQRRGLETQLAGHVARHGQHQQRRDGLLGSREELVERRDGSRSQRSSLAARRGRIGARRSALVARRDDHVRRRDDLKRERFALERQLADPGLQERLSRARSVLARGEEPPQLTDRDVANWVERRRADLAGPADGDRNLLAAGIRPTAYRLAVEGERRGDPRAATDAARWRLQSQAAMQRDGAVLEQYGQDARPMTRAERRDALARARRPDLPQGRPLTRYERAQALDGPQGRGIRDDVADARRAAMRDAARRRQERVNQRHNVWRRPR